MKTVLVADDDGDTRDTLAMVLASTGYRVYQASDGVLALELLRARRVDLALVDLRMPKVDGVELIRVMRADNVLARIPVLIMTALRGARVPPCLPILYKPFGVESLLEAVEETMGSRPAPPPARWQEALSA